MAEPNAAAYQFNNAPKGPVTILVVDDEEPIRSALKRFLSQQNFEVLTAGNGAEVSGVDVSVRSFDVERPQLHGGTITIAGVATTRKSLADFRDIVSKDSAFSKTDLPIGNLIKDRDVLFSMKITLATSTL